MPREIIRYKLDGDGSVPVFVLDGGYFYKDHEFIGVSVDSDERYVPASVKRLSKDELFKEIKNRGYSNYEEVYLEFICKLYG